MRDAVNDRALRGIAETLARFPKVETAVLFGSRAKGCHEPWSDIDLMLTGDLKPIEAQHIEEELEELSVPVFFDVQTERSIRYQPLREHIRRVGQVIYQRGNKALPPTEDPPPSTG